MNERLASFITQLDLNPGAPAFIVKDVQARLGISLPEGYLEFIAQSNGAEGFVGSSYLVLWPIEEIIDTNQAYNVDKFAPGLILFGGDGGGEAYAFDTRSYPIAIVQVPLIGIDVKEAWQCGRTFEEFLEFLYTQE